MNAEIAAFFHENERILRFVHYTRTSSGSRTTEHVYPDNVTAAQLNEQPIIAYPLSIVGEDAKWEVNIGLNKAALFSQTSVVLLVLAGISFAAYWILYSGWNMMNAYRMGRLNALWIVLFCTLNVFAYLLFRLELSMKTRKLKAAV